MNQIVLKSAKSGLRRQIWRVMRCFASNTIYGEHPHFNIRIGSREVEGYYLLCEFGIILSVSVYYGESENKCWLKREVAADAFLEAA